MGREVVQAAVSSAQFTNLVHGEGLVEVGGAERVDAGGGDEGGEEQQSVPHGGEAF